MRAIVKIVLLSITLWIVMSSHGHAQSAIQTDAIEVTSYELQSQKRVSRFDFEYTYNVTFTNTGETLAGVQGLVISNNPSVTLISGQVDIGNIAASSQVTATIGIQHSRRARFSQSNLEWTFTAEEANQAPSITLIGDNPLFTQVGEQYIDPGANGLDAEDGALPVEIDDSAVNTADAGEYLVSFNVTDSNGLAADTVFRSVIVEQTEIQITNRILIHKVGNGELITAQPEKIACFDNNICEVFLSQGESIELEAIAESGFTFDGYRSCEQSSGDICTLTYDSSKAVIASFVKELVLEDNVIQLNEKQIALLQNYTEGTNELVFSSFVDPTGFDIGNILVADDYTNFPDNIVVFAERIVDIQTDTDGTLRLRVVPATIDDVIKVGSFTQADIEARIGNSALQIQSLTAVMPSGERIAMTEQKSDVVSQSTSDKISFVDARTFKVNIDGKGEIEVTLTVDGSPFFGIGFKGFKPNEVILSYDLFLDATIKVTAIASIDDWDPISFVDFRYGCIPIGPGICLYTVFSAGPSASLEVATEVETNTNFTLDITAGVHILDGKKYGIFDIDPSVVNSGELILDNVNARIEGGLDFKLSAYFNALFGPFVEVNPYVATTSELRNSQVCPVHVYTEQGVRVNIGGEINFINAKLEFTVAEWKKLVDLNDACAKQDPPSRPNIISLVNSGNRIFMLWEKTDSPADGVTYAVYSTTSGRRLLDDGLASTGYVDTLISPSLEYCYVVVATNNFGLSTEGNEKCVPFVEPNRSAPTTPTNFVVETQDDVTFHFSWGASMDDVDDSSLISYSLFESDVVNGRVYLVESTSDTNISIVPNRDALTCYFIVANDSEGNSSSESNVICVDSVSPSPVGIAPPTQFEAIELNSNVTGELNDSDDADWYKFELPDDGSIRLHITRQAIKDGITNEFFNATLYVQNVDGSLSEINSFTVITQIGNYPNYIFTGMGAGTYFIKLDASVSQSEYLFKVEHIETGVINDSEPNNTVGDALSLALNTSTVGRLGYPNDGVRDDADWYKFELPDDGSIRLHITRQVFKDGITNEFFNATLYVQNVDGSLSEINSFTVITQIGNYPNYIFTGMGAGTYFIKLDASVSQSEYLFKVEHIETGVINDSEPNNTVGDALSLALNTSTVGRLGYPNDGVRDDADWYKFELPDDGSIRLRITRQAFKDGITNEFFNATLYVQNVDGSLSEINSFTVITQIGNYPNYIFTGMGAGTYFIKLDASVSQSEYLFKVEHIETGVINDSEPNNTVGDALSLALNTSTVGRLGYPNDGVRDDADWYKFELPDDGSIRLRITRQAFKDGITNEFFNATLYVQNVDGSLSEINSFTVITQIGNYPNYIFTGMGAGTYFIKLDASVSQSEYLFKVELL